MARKPIAIDADLHAAWTAAAKAEGLSLAGYVTRAVEATRTGLVVLPEGENIIRVRRTVNVSMPVVAPKDCTNRVRPGTYCKVCGAVHR